MKGLVRAIAMELTSPLPADGLFMFGLDFLRRKLAGDSFCLFPLFSFPISLATRCLASLSFYTRNGCAMSFVAIPCALQPSYSHLHGVKLFSFLFLGLIDYECI